jgi:hypothetical protein
MTKGHAYLRRETNAHAMRIDLDYYDEDGAVSEPGQRAASHRRRNNRDRGRRLRLRRSRRR